MSAPYFYATKVLSLQIDVVIAPWDWNWQKREQFAGNMCSWVVLAVRKKGRRKIPKSEGITKIRCFDHLMFPSKTNVLLGWSKAGKKNSTKFRTKGDLKLKFCTKQKKTTPTCEHIHILSTLKPPTKQEGIPQISSDPKSPGTCCCLSLLPRGWPL